MAKIDEMVLSMDFDNSRFKQGASETLSVLDRLKKNLNFDSIKGAFKGSTDEVSALQKQVQEVDLNSISSQLEGMSRQWSVWGTVGRTAIARITNSVLDLGGKLKSLVWDPIVSGGMNRAKNLEQANFMLQGIVGGAEDGAAQIEMIMDNANTAVSGTAYGLDSAAKAAAQFAATGMRGGDKMVSTLRGIAGVASMTSSEYDDIARIFTTVSGQGRLMTEQLNQMASRGINAAASLAEHFGVTEGALREMVTEGKVSFDDFAEAMDNAFGAQSQRANETYSGSLSNVRAALGRIGAPVATAHLETMRDVFNSLRPAINAVNEALQPFVGILVDRIGRAGVMITKPVQAFTSALEAFNAGAEVSPAWRGFFSFIQDLGVIMGLVGDVFADAIKVILGGTPRFIEMSDTLSESGTKIYHIFRQVLSFLMLGPEIIGMVLREVLGLSDGAGSLGDTLLDLVGHVASFLYIAAEWIRESRLLQVGISTIGAAARIVVGSFALFGRSIAWVADLVVGLLSKLAPVGGFLSGLSGKFADFWLSVMDFEFPDVEKVLGFFSDLWDKVKSFRIPKLNLSGFRTFGDILQNVSSWFGTLVQGIRDFELSDIGNMFAGIGTWFSGLSMPEFNMDGLTNLRDTVSQFVGGKFNDMKMSGNLDFALNIRNKGMKAIDFIRSIDYGGIATGVGRNVKKAFTTALDVLSDLGSWVSDNLGSVDWGGVGRSIGEGITRSLDFLKETGAKIAEFLTDGIKSAVEKIDIGAIWENLKDFGSNAKDAIGDAIDGVVDGVKGDAENLKTDVEVDVKVKSEGLETVEAMASDQGIVGRIKGVATAIGELFKSLSGDFDANAIAAGFGETIGGGLTAATTKIREVGTSFTNAISFITNPIQTGLNNAKAAATTGITDFGNTVASTLSGAFTTISENFDAGVLVDIVNSVSLLFAGLAAFDLAKSISGFTNALAAVPTAVAGFFNGLTTTIQSFGEAAKIEAQGNAILKIAASLAILVAAVWVLSKVPWDEMQVGLGATIGLLAALVAAVVVLDKTLSDDSAEKIGALGDAFIKIGIAVGVLAASVWLLGNMDFTTVLQGFGVALLAILALTGGAALAGLTKGVAGLGAAFLGLAAGVAILAGAFLIFKMVNYDEIEKGLVTLTAALLAISVAARIADGKKLAGAGVAMLGVGAGLLGLAYGIKAIANLDTDQLQKGLGVLAGVMAGIALMTRLAGGQMAATVGTLVGLSVGIVAMAYAIQLISDIDFGSAAGGMLVLTGGIIGMGLALRAFPKDAPKITASLIGLALGMGILIAAIWVVGNMDFGTLAQGLIVLAAALGGIVAALTFLPPNVTGQMVALSVGLLALSGSLLVFAFAMQSMESVSWETMGKAAAVIGVLILALAGLGAIGAYIGPGLTAIGIGLAAIGGGLLVIAASVWVFADAVSTLVDSLVSLGDNADAVEEGLAQAGSGITKFAEEAREGLQILIDIVKDAGALNMGALALLFNSFSDIPSDIGSRFDGLVHGLTQLETVLPIVQQLNDFGKQVGFGDNKSIGGFFRALGEVDPSSGEGMSSIVQGLRDIETVMPIIQKLNDFGKQVGFGDNTSIGGFFRALGEVDAGSGEGMSAVVQGLRDIETVLPVIQQLNDFGKQVGTGDNTSIAGFFNAFKDIDVDLGTSIAGMANGLRELETVLPVIQKFNEFGKQVGFGDNTSIGGFFDAFQDIDADLGGSVSSLAGGLRELESVLPVVQKLNDFGKQIGFGDNKSIAGFFSSLAENIPSDLGSRLTETSDGMNALNAAIPALNDAVSQLESVNLESLQTILSDIEVAFSSGVGEGINGAAEAITNAVTAMLTAATERTSDFETAGTELGQAVGNGVEAAEGDVSTKARALGSEAAKAARRARSAMEAAGRFIGQGLAQGIRDSTEAVTTAAAELARAATAAAEANLDIASPSRVFMQIGNYVGEGFAIGISDEKPGVVNAIVDTMDAAIKAMGGKTFELKDSTKGFYDSILDQLNNNPITRRIEQLGRHSQAAYATSVKEKRIQDELDREAAEDEKERAYRDVEDAKRSVEDARKALRDAEQQELSESRTAADHAQDIADKKRSIEDAEKKHRRSIAARDRYEYQMHGSEAGVAFVDGVAEGIIDNSDQLPSVAEIFSAVLMEELDYVKQQANDFIGVFEGLSSARTSFRTITDEARNLRRAIGRLGTATSSRSYRRHMDAVIDSTLAVAQEFVGLMDILDKFEPYLPMLLEQFSGALPAIASAVAPFAPGLAETLGGGLGVALPAILGPVTAIIAAIGGIGVFLYDMANEQTLLKLLRSVFFGFINFLRELPERLPRLLKTLIRGFVNLVKELPYLVGDLAIALVEAFVEIIVMLPEMLPDLLTALIDAFIEIITFLPVALVENSGRILMALLNGFGRLVVGLVTGIPRMFIQVGIAIIDGIIRGITGFGGAVWDALGRIFTGVVDFVKDLLGIRSPSRVFANIGENLMEGLVVGVEDKSDYMEESIKSAIRRIIDELDDGPDGQITITPVIDATEATKGLQDLTRNLSEASISADANYDAAASVSAIRSEEEVLRQTPAENVTHIEYTQNNTSPKPLSAIEIYRNTQKQLEMMK